MKAFTLSEVLITLGIIGVVAALTLPSVMQQWQEKTTISKLKKMYATLQQAYDMNRALNEIKLEETLAENNNAAKEVAAIFVPYLHISKDCGTDKIGCCYSGVYKWLSGSDAYKFDVGGIAAYRILLNDGSSIFFRRGRSSTSYKYGSNIFYDINGYNPPNTIGKDLFMFEVVNDRVLPMGMDETSNPFGNTNCNKNGRSIGCTAWVLQEENFEYLKCTDLQLNGPKKKCN